MQTKKKSTRINSDTEEQQKKISHKNNKKEMNKKE